MHEIAQNCGCNAQKSLAAASWGSTPDPAGELMTLPQTLVDWGGGKSLPQTSPPQRFRHLASSSSATQVQCASPKTIFCIRPWAAGFKTKAVASENEAKT